MKKRENWAERFERKKEEREEFILNISKERQLEEYNNRIKELKNRYEVEKRREYEIQIEILENMLEAYLGIKRLSIEGIDVISEIQKLEDSINYLKFKKQYMEEHDVEEIEVEKVKKEVEIQHMYDEEELDNLKKRRTDRNHLESLKKKLDESEDSQSWKEYMEEEEAREK